MEVLPKFLNSKILIQIIEIRKLAKINTILNEIALPAGRKKWPIEINQLTIGG